MTQYFTSRRVAVQAAFVTLALLILMALPAMASAATYAYVNQTGEVRTVEAATPTVAISTAPGIHLHSGVMLLTNPADDIVGDNVNGI